MRGAITCLLLLLTPVIAAPVLARDKVINVPTEDPEMLAAIEKARASLPKFWEEMAARRDGVDGFSLKVRIPYDAANGEHFWLVDIKRLDGKLSGVISNDPNYATHVAKGQRYEFKEADVSDWMFMRNGKMVGNETMRPLLKRMPNATAEQYRSLYEAP